jgi:endonuclease/exonuclease/phosphatase (EEP) superfamily protein YafD
MQNDRPLTCRGNPERRGFGMICAGGLRHSMKLLIPYLVLLPGAVALSGCAAFSSHPPETSSSQMQLATHNHPIESVAAECRQRLADTFASEGPELNPDNISLLSWNIKKGQRALWQDDFSELAAGKDLVLIQEAALQPDLTETLTDFFHWAFGPGYRTKQNLTGVMTFSNSVPMTHCNLTSWEPWLRTPKATTVTEYGLSGSDETLVVVNIHAVNFTFGVAEYESQISQVREVLADHSGPIILSGDFNTWRKKRLRILESMTDDLGLHALSFEDDHRTTVFGNRIDHIYVRGLTAEATATRQVTTSDHNPLSAELRM